MDPIGWFASELFTFGTLADLLIWTAIVLFLLAGLIEWRGHRSGDRQLVERARTISVAAFVVFGFFWLNVFPYFAFDHQSYIEGILSLAGFPLSLYTGYQLYRGRDSLFILSRAIGVMGLIYMPFETIPAMTIAGVEFPEPRQVLIELVAVKTAFFIDLLGYTPEFTESPEGYRAGFLWTLEGGHTYRISVVLACTGIGSMAIFGGLITSVNAPIGRKLRALAVSIPLIYALNLVRTTFIVVVSGNQYMHWFPDLVLFLFGESNPYRVSFLVSDRILSQTGAVIALMVITYLVVRQLPELLVVLEDLLYLLTGNEYDLQGAIDLPREPVATDPALADDRPAADD